MQRVVSHSANVGLGYLHNILKAMGIFPYLSTRLY